MPIDLIDYPIPVNRGGTGKSVRSYAFDNIAPQNPEVGSIIVWDGQHWVASDTDVVGTLEDMTETQEQLLESVSELNDNLMLALRELRKIKYGIMTIVDKHLEDLED